MSEKDLKSALALIHRTIQKRNAPKPEEIDKILAAELRRIYKLWVTSGWRGDDCFRALSKKALIILGDDQ